MNSSVYLENTTEGHNKFWQAKIWVTGNDEDFVSINWGKIGTTGQQQTKAFDTRLACQLFINKKAQEKLKEGYVLVSEFPNTINATEWVKYGKKLNESKSLDSLDKEALEAVGEEGNFLIPLDYNIEPFSTSRFAKLARAGYLKGKLEPENTMFSYKLTEKGRKSIAKRVRA